MKFFSLSFLLLLTTLVQAQVREEEETGEDYGPVISGQALPLYIDIHGKISFHLLSAAPDVAFNPSVQFARRKATFLYSPPVPLENYVLRENQQNETQVEYRTRQIEWGVGGEFSHVLKFGLYPYRGSYQSTVRQVTPGEQAPAIGLPQKLAELECWSIQDSGAFQTYGGISVQASFSVAGQRTITAILGIQNNFTIRLQKMTEDHVLLSLSEEDQRYRKLRLGPASLNYSWSKIQGQLFHASFNLKLSEPLHHALYEKALAGDIQALQVSLDHHSQRISWAAKERRLVFAIPELAGEQRTWFEEGNEQGKGLYIKEKKTKGALTKFRHHKTYVQHDEKGLIIMWVSLMKKVDRTALEKKFLRRARLLGLKQLDHIPAKGLLGNFILHTGLGLSCQEVSKITESDLPQIALHLRSICLEENLDCQHSGPAKQIILKFGRMIKQPYLASKRELGILLSEEPALIKSLIRVKGWQKQVYVKFLSQKFQSFEGVQDIPL